MCHARKQMLPGIETKRQVFSKVGLIVDENSRSTVAVVVGFVLVY